MIKDILKNYTNLLIKDGINITKEIIVNNISILEESLRKIKQDYNNTSVYIDIKDRELFLYLFAALSELKAKVILLPVEIKSEDYYYDGIFYITDNKELDFGLFLKKDLTFIEKKLVLANIKLNKSDDVFFYLYTSGSTGKAKLIPKSFLNIITELKELQSILNITDKDTFYFTPPLYHIYGILFGLFLPLYSNAKLIIDYHFTPDSISQFIKENNITIFVSIPSYYKMFKDLNLIGDFELCRRLLNSSAPLPFEISKEFYNNGIEITEIYGSTETGGIAYRSAAKSLDWNLFSYIDIIRSRESTENDMNNYTELIINSQSISDIYDKTKGYNTGDIVEFLEGNKFSLLGRNTRFVKISGKRVDLKYVENKVKEYLTGITKSKISEDSIYAGEKNEKIFVFFETSIKIQIEQIKKELKEHLPGYAVPRFFYNQTIPRNNMGKINKMKIDEITKNI